MGTGNSTIIELKQVTKHYVDPATGVTFQALKGVDLQFSSGQLYTIVGPSGAGKTTLVNIICGMTRPSTGEIIVDGLNLHLMDEIQLDLYRLHKIGYLWQRPADNLLPELSVEGNLSLVLEIADYPRHKLDERITELLEIVGLSDKKEQQVNSLSGGEAQRIGLAVALANDPEILILDEPTGELDVKTSSEIRAFLRKLTTEFGYTIIVVTHDSAFKDVSDNTYSIHDGVITNLRRRKFQKYPQSGSYQESDKMEDMVPIDSNGRITLSDKYIEKYQFKKFVKIIEKEDGIEIRPVEDEEDF